MKTLLLLLLSLLAGGDVFAMSMQEKFSLMSPNFENGKDIPKECGYRDKNRSPELIWNRAPSKTKSFAIVVIDPDAPSKEFVHWIIYNIPASKKSLSANLNHDVELDDNILQGLNDFNNIGYDGPAPPPKEKHSYVFTIYALDCVLLNIPCISLRKLQDLMKDHILATAEIVGYFEGEIHKTTPNPPIKGKRVDEDPNAKEQSSYPE